MDVDIWSDIACPWCYVGKRRLERALAEFEHGGEVSVRWHSFELDPRAPAERSGDYADGLAAKYGLTRERAQEMLEGMRSLAEEEGLDFHFERMRAANTFDAHRLLQLALAEGRGDEMKERLMRAHFVEGELVSDHAVLERLAGDAGLEPGRAHALLEGEELTEEVRTDEYTAQRLGIRGVPFFVIDRAFAVEGAQSPEHLLAALERAWEAGGHGGQPATAGAAGETCGPEGC